jgi:uncharacterized membrane protein
MTRAIAIVSTLGLLVSGYLTYVHYADVEALCSAISDCTRVQNSDFSDLAGIPVAVLGLLGYIGVLVSLRIPGENARLATALLAFVGFGYSAYLTYVELFRIDAICQWCVASALLMAALAVLAARRVLTAPVARTAAP